VTVRCRGPHLARRSSRLAALGLLVLSGLAVMPGSAAAPRMTVTPAQGPVDDRVRVRVIGLPARTPVTLSARTTDVRGAAWSSRITLQTTAHGAVDTRGDMSLFWKMKPSRRALALSTLTWGHSGEAGTLARD
jgi:hypothetical protein